MDQGKWKTLRSSFDDALARIPAALTEQGFGIVSQIDLGETIRAKLGKDVGRYRIIGACNPGFAFDAVTREPRVGVLLPCNVVLYEQKDGKAVLGAVDPMQMIATEPALKELAAEVSARLERFIASIA